jgi:hypothetical protein
MCPTEYLDPLAEPHFGSRSQLNEVPNFQKDPPLEAPAHRKIDRRLGGSWPGVFTGPSPEMLFYG